MKPAFPSRRELLLGGSAVLAAASCGGGRAAAPTSMESTSPTSNTGGAPARQPVTFVSHGAPSLALDLEQGADLARWEAGLPRPVAYLVVSAHWEATPATVGTTTARELLHDYGGFAPELRHVRHDAPGLADDPGNADLVAEVRARTSAGQDPRRPWDHGVWVPLRHLDPGATTPVLQLSLPSRASGAELLELGRRLAPLRERGVRLLASGGMVHNLGELVWDGDDAPPSWAVEFEAWVREALLSGDLDALADVGRRAPAARRAHPTLEHYLPLLVAAGAGEGGSVTFPVQGFEYGSLSRTSVQLG